MRAARACQSSASSLYRSELDHHVAQIGVKLERVYATFAADARGLGAAKRGPQVAQKPAVDPGEADVDALRHPVGAADVLREDRRRQSVAVGVDLAQHLLFAVEGADVAAGAEDLVG